MVNSNGEIGFGGGLSGHWCGFRHRLQLLVEASPASGESAVCQVRTGWIEAEEFGEDDLELVFDVGQSGDVVEEGWCGPVDDFLVDLEGCTTSDFPSV